ncbi:MAG: Gfo/Idh/MocA family oxidoreductase [Pedosphaera sp.]|nr:Gfo/Idh/MocA family oxidoreductase [Pedosphaera sp.]
METKPSKTSNVPATRREFLKKTAVATAAVAASPLLRPTLYGQAPSANVTGANNRIVLGYIGVGNQGLNIHVNLLKKSATANNLAQAAVCDVWTKRVGAAKALIEKDNADAKVDTYGDYQKLLERKDLDAVVIATHDPIHAPAIIAALESGKHVYCEKPVSRYLDEAFAVHEAVKRTGKILQIGSQGCSAAAWHKAAEMIQAGKIGQLVWAQGFYCRNSKEGEWNKAAVSEDMTPDSIDWAKWLGRVSKRPFKAEQYARWRKFYPFCAGLLGDLVPHRLLPLMLATGKPEFPTRVVCVGTKSIHSDKGTQGAAERDSSEHLQVVAEFPSGLIMTITAGGVAARTPGFAIYGHQASLDIGTSGERIKLLPEKEFADEIEDESLDGLKPIEDFDVHHKNWLDSIRANKQPNCNVDLAVRAQTVISLAEMSERLKVACLFDEKTRKITTGDGKEVPPLTYGSTELS